MGRLDATAGVVESRAVTEPRLLLVQNPGNRGKGFAIRHGMLQAKGDWIYFRTPTYLRRSTNFPSCWLPLRRRVRRLRSARARSTVP